MSIRTRASWGARHRDGVGTRPVGSLEKYLHHTVTRHLPRTATVAEEQLQMRVVEQIGQDRFKGGISYNFGIFPSGRIYQGASVDRIAYHSGAGRNTRGVGIVLVGNTEASQMTTEQLAAVVWLLQHGVQRGWWGDPALTEGHRDFSATACPGRHAYGQIGEINRRGRGQAAKPPAQPTPAPTPPSGGGWPASAMTINGNRTAEWDAAWRRLLGDIGMHRSGDANLTVGFQRWLTALGFYNRAIDGSFGGFTVAALQRFLRNRGHYPNPVTWTQGDRGDETIRSEKRYLNSQRRFYS